MVPGKIPYKKISYQELNFNFTTMTRYILPVLIMLLLIAGSCAGRKSRVDRKNRIPDQDLVPILTEMYLSDGLLALPEISYHYSDQDTISTYMDILQRYGYTKEMMDRTMRYYFIKKPKKLIKLYDMVLGALSEMESRVDKEIPVFEKESLNVWKEKPGYYFFDRSRPDTSSMNIRINYLRNYSFKFTVTIYPDDQTVNPHPGIYYTYTDSTLEDRHYLTSFPYLKDGRPHTYNIRFILDKPLPGILKGWFIDHGNQDPDAVKHYSVEDIILTPGQF
jgi:hypothetical protein